MHAQLKKDDASLQKKSSDRHQEGRSHVDQNSDLLSGENTEGFTSSLSHALPTPGQGQLVMQCKGLSESPEPAKISGPLIQRRANNTGLPDKLKTGIENLSGISMDDVTVHYNSSKPAQLRAHAYTQGTAIHVAPGQEQHLPHEAWHVVQQKQGRVRPTTQLKGKVPVNDDVGLEKEADVMGQKALHHQGVNTQTLQEQKTTTGAGTYQMLIDEEQNEEFLRKIYRKTKELTPKPSRGDLWDIIYDAFGVEPNSNYTSQKGDETLVSDLRFMPQGGWESWRRGFSSEFQKAKEAKDTNRLRELRSIGTRFNKQIRAANKKSKARKQYLTKADMRQLNQMAFKEGDYFFIRRPHEVTKAVNAADQNPATSGTNTPSERLILNTKSPGIGAGLLRHILDGWADTTNRDWRSKIRSGKFYGIGPDALKERNAIKYDKVVLYYLRKDRSDIEKGVKERVPESMRNEKISGLYNKLGKGIGVGEEKVDKLGSSFTTRRTNSLINWIRKDWKRVCWTDEATFIKEAKRTIYADMRDEDLAEGMEFGDLFEWLNFSKPKRLDPVPDPQGTMLNELASLV